MEKRSLRLPKLGITNLAPVSNTNSKCDAIGQGKIPSGDNLSLPRLDSSSQSKMSRAAANKNNSLKQPKEEINIKYMHRPPLITPNYGSQNRSLLPKSKVSRVLLYDNATQDHMLDIKLAHIKIEKERISRIINLHKRSFSSRMMKKQHIMQALLNGNKLNPSASISDISSPRVSHSQQFGKSGRPFSYPPINGQREQNHEMEIESNASVGDIKLPNMDDDDKRHVIFKVKDKDGRTEVYHTVDEKGVLSDIIPRYYSKLTDDPRFKLLQRSLVPPENSETFN